MIELILPRTRPNRPFRLRCRFKTDPNPADGWLKRQAVRVAEQFVSDMHKQGWTHDTRYNFRLRGPFTPVEPTTIHPHRIPSAREMLPGLMLGEQFRDEFPSGVSLALPLGEVGYWEYEISAVFTRPEIILEYANPHEESYA